MFERTPDDTPPDDLTVVVVALVGGAALDQCLAALKEQVARIVVVGHGAPDQTGDAGASVPDLRMAALVAARTPYVAFLEDTAVPGPRWRQGLQAAFAEGAAAVAGPIVVSPQLSPRYRALGLSEYARFHPISARRAGQETSATLLPGLAFAVARDAVLPMLDDHAGLIEGPLSHRLIDAGQTVGTSKDMEVRYAVEHEQGGRLRTRFQHGRLFAGRRFAKTFPARRLAYAAGALLLPVIQVRRALRDHPRDLNIWPGTVLWLCLLCAAWSAGEFTGYLTGSVGNAAESWT